MEYILDTGKGKIPMYFGTWAISRFCELNGNLSFTQMQDLFETGFSIKHIISLFLCSAEHYARKNKKPFDYTDVDASDWIDEMGGMTSEKFAEVMVQLIHAINPHYQGVELSKGEKKSDPLVGSSSEPIVSGQELKAVI